jgi:DNA-binding response OmpR family regulator
MGEGRKEKVLVVEEDASTARLIRLILDGVDYVVHLEADSRAALAAAEDLSPGVVVFDLALSDIRGENFVAALQRVTKAPVIVLSAGAPAPVIVECLSAGAFDVMFKPFDPDDLSQNVGLALASRAHTATSAAEYGRVSLEPASRIARINGRDIPLSLTEWRLIELLLSRKGETVLYQEILTRVWGPLQRDNLEMVRAWVARLTKKIGVRDFHGVGYSLNLPHSKPE